MRIKYIIAIVIITLSMATSCKNGLDSITGATKATTSDSAKTADK